MVAGLMGGGIMPESWLLALTILVALIAGVIVTYMCELAFRPKPRTN